MESDLRDASPLKHALEHIVHAVRRDGTTVGRRKHILVIGLSLLLPQNFGSLGRDADRPVGVFGFQRCFHDLKNTVRYCLN